MQYFWIEGDKLITSEEDLVDDFEDDVFHAWEIELFDCHLDRILDPDSHMKLINIIVLNTQDQVHLQTIWSFAISTQQMNQVIKYMMGEGLNVFYDEQYTVLISIVVQHIHYSVERLLFHV